MDQKQTRNASSERSAFFSGHVDGVAEISKQVARRFRETGC